jgi:hypothetical protein
MSKPILLFCAVALLFTGCESNRPLTKDDGENHTLVQVGELCRHYQVAKSKPPSKPADLALVRTMGANGYSALTSGAVVLLYGATLPDLSDEPGNDPSDQILAYTKETPDSGGKVLLLNRTVKSMTADEFKAAKLAGTPAPASAAKSTKKK